MIKYKSDFFGYKSLFVWNGSAVFRAFLPAAFSNGLLVLYMFIWGDDVKNETLFVSNPYVITVFIFLVGFLLVFRLNYSYQRYWEAATEIHKMMGGWLDSAICLAAFHYQCGQYDERRPLSFGANSRARNETRERERIRAEASIRNDVITVCTNDAAKKSFFRRPFQRRKAGTSFLHSQSTIASKTLQPNNNTVSERVSVRFTNMSKLNSGSTIQKVDRSKWRASFAAGRFSEQGGSRLLKLTGLETTTPSLFLQEAAHLYSLLSAVAMSTLRSDIEGVSFSLAAYKPDLPFPAENPDELGPDIRLQYYYRTPFLNFIYYMFGLKKTQRERTMYNAARPFRVIGGISDDEARCLQQVKGPYAQMTLCNMWVKEFITREHLNGSTGNVAPPIFARVYQFLSVGVTGYNNCRKIAFVPFPFPHDQATIFFSMISLFIFPILYVGYVNDLILAHSLNFFTVLSFCGVNEVARELSDPFHTYPNDLPLNNFQAQMNEALVSMWAGFHPDAWRIDEARSEFNESVSSNSSMSNDEVEVGFSKTVDVTGHVKINVAKDDGMMYHA